MPVRCGSDHRNQRAGRLVADLLRTLLESLEAPHSDGNGANPGVILFDRSEDGGYIYLDFQLPGFRSADIDLNLHEDRVMIRVAHLERPD